MYAINNDSCNDSRKINIPMITDKASMSVSNASCAMFDTESTSSVTTASAKHAVILLMREMNVDR